MNKVHNAASRLERLISNASAKLSQVNDFSVRPAPGKWSKKEIVGHLIDSANNNHQRFVRGQFESVPEIAYAQNEWVSAGGYQELDDSLVVALWTQYNLFLIQLMRNMPESMYSRVCSAHGEHQTLGWLMVDYVDHLEHHLKQVVG